MHPILATLVFYLSPTKVYSQEKLGAPCCFLVYAFRAEQHMVSRWMMLSALSTGDARSSGIQITEVLTTTEPQQKFLQCLVDGL